MAQLRSTDLLGCNSIPDFIAGGSRMIFQQTNAPPNWTKITTFDNRALRVVNGTAGSGGSLTFTSAFAVRATGGSVQGHTLSVAEMPSHAHGVADPGHAHDAPWFRGVGRGGASWATANGGDNRRTNGSGVGIGIFGNGSSGAHAHGFVGNPIDMTVQYVDVILASKN